MSERAAEAMRDAAGVVLVAQAHAGWVALDLARRFPERVVGLLSLSWILDDPPAPFVAALEAMAAAGTTRAAVDELTGMWLKGGEDPAVRDHVERVMRTHPDAAWARAAREILAAYRREGSPRRALARLPRPVSFAHVDSPSHFPAIDRTEEVAAAARALAAGLPRSAAR
jgi:pimeloyl-ACP methyl ester carboxylesterase